MIIKTLSQQRPRSKLEEKEDQTHEKRICSPNCKNRTNTTDLILLVLKCWDCESERATDGVSVVYESELRDDGRRDKRDGAKNEVDSDVK